VVNFLSGKSKDVESEATAIVTATINQAK
jgi:hypothetical protein